ncbi:hypothetical protein BD311DRAFT_765954 [Dichomitus squalens]|uniref:Uncharacterized protein n=1 Tax=Dichomitus squalens TaxID=114155 RepID=A0A4Q9MFA4_9APHY|nr:hypothetical protein BD311DRAFT_765954 [Dichomitus squalens]TBU63511.1 hypothetical protein BD310DRAFT_916543 [Dichomitus squalens]
MSQSYPMITAPGLLLLLLLIHLSAVLHPWRRHALMAFLFLLDRNLGIMLRNL